MSSKVALIGTVLLEAYWSSRQKDMLDLIAPFVQYGVAKTTTTREKINASAVTSIIRNEFGYTDIPEAAIIKVMNRDPEHFEKKNKNYYLKTSLDEQMDRLNRRRTECLSKIDSTGRELYNYLRDHCKKNKVTSEEQCIEFLQRFFEIFALQIGFDSLEQESISYKNDEVNYYIAQYIFEKKRENKIEYETILDLTKGYLLQSAIYLQMDNPDIRAASYKNTSFYYDTPFLIQLLGYQSEEEADSARALHRCLKRQGAKFYYFPQNDKELTAILTAYQYSLIGQQRSYKTLEGLDSKKYGFQDVSRIKKNYQSVLKDEYGIELSDLPAYAVTDAGTVDVNRIDIVEADAMEYVRNHTEHYTEENLYSDISSALGIHRLRKGRFSQSIESCIALFVTTNVDFTKAFNDYYRNIIGGNRVMPVITSFDLSAIAWVKGGNINSDIPERQLLTNSYLALQPAPEILERCRCILTQLESEGNITEEDAVSLRADRVTQRELWIELFPNPENIDEKYVERLLFKQKEKLTREAKEETANQFRQKEESAQNKRIREAQQKARDYSQKKRKRFENTLKIIIIVLSLAIIMGCIYGLVATAELSHFNLFMCLFILVSILSIYDTVSSRSKLVGKWVAKKANYYETTVYETKLEEYRSVLQEE